jgi:hypothetical protein
MGMEVEMEVVEAVTEEKIGHVRVVRAILRPDSSVSNVPSQNLVVVQMVSQVFHYITYQWQQYVD